MCSEPLLWLKRCALQVRPLTYVDTSLTVVYPHPSLGSLEERGPTCRRRRTSSEWLCQNEVSVSLNRWDTTRLAHPLSSGTHAAAELFFAPVEEIETLCVARWQSFSGCETLRWNFHPSYFVGSSPPPPLLIGSFVSSYKRRRRKEEPSAHSVKEVFTVAGGRFGLNESPSVWGPGERNAVIPWLGQEGLLKKAAPTYCDD